MATASIVNVDQPEMQECFSFRLVLCGMDEITDEIEQKLWEAGCSDGMVGIHAGTPYMAFDREADSLEAAINSAIQQVENSGVGLQVVRVVPPGADTIDNINAYLRLRQQKANFFKHLPPDVQRKVAEILAAVAESNQEHLVHALDDK